MTVLVWKFYLKTLLARPTQAMSQFYQQVFATEVSGPMRKHLALKGFHVLDIDQWTKARYPNPDYQEPHLIIAGRRV